MVRAGHQSCNFCILTSFKEKTKVEKGKVKMLYQ
jgi:hypothetical protein